MRKPMSASIRFWMSESLSPSSIQAATFCFCSSFRFIVCAARVAGIGLAFQPTFALNATGASVEKLGNGAVLAFQLLDHPVVVANAADRMNDEIAAKNHEGQTQHQQRQQ